MWAAANTTEAAKPAGLGAGAAWGAGAVLTQQKTHPCLQRFEPCGKGQAAPARHCCLSWRLRLLPELCVLGQLENVCERGQCCWRVMCALGVS